ncbi:MAG: hypothetical protein WBO44_13665, partial [Saprospiraceae bacterium]
VRFIDAFVDQLDLFKIGFEVKTLKTEGRPSFEASTLLKIFLYGYLNGLRISRRFECEGNTKVNCIHFANPADNTYIKFHHEQEEILFHQETLLHF